MNDEEKRDLLYELEEIAERYGLREFVKRGSLAVVDGALTGVTDLSMSGSIGSSMARVVKGWFKDLEIKNTPTVDGDPIALISDIARVFNAIGVVESDLFSLGVTLGWLSESLATLDGVAVKHSLAEAVGDFLVGAGTSTFTFVKKTLAEVKAILGLGSAAYTSSGDYAVSGKGVTNGDSHDHAGGDGAQIDHGGLGGLSDDDHSQYLLAGGSRVLSADWDIGDNRMIQTDKIRARDSAGLSLFEDGGAGIFVKDGGNVAIGTTDGGAKFEVDTTAAVIGQITKGASLQTANLHEWRDSAGTVLACISKVGAIGINTNDADNADGIYATSAETGLIRIVGNPTGKYGGLSSTRLLPKITGIGRWCLQGLGDDFITVERRGNFEIYDINSATPRVIIDGSGRTGINAGYTQPFVAALEVYSTVTTMPNLYLKCVANQTADIMQLINSSGTVLSCFTAGGKFGAGTSTPVAQLAINGGLAVGEDADPGDNNLKVVGNAEIDGDLNHDGSNVGFYGTAPAAQHAAIANATDAASAITQLNLALATLRSLGLIAT